MKDYNLSFAEIEEMPLEILLDLEVVDSKIDAAFEEQRDKKKTPSKRQVYIDEIL